ncbi:phosphate ABC transporter permease subunit PstC [Sulfuriroseicoccus oceanibius]|uniref:Phosphate transport system permease protein n=1 Tax=Sulfuriroseicoccus oceanibius TaxID=2707525 RepID=A0A7T7F3R0_9BACT|nr:phosphate ABC transporter permease subunit PstC [Sulfuriroseicoccus oceanibius]QQL46262.1 phosphate ABC transporter permease subunit PstC [Sulfuriroseicoccus oceanibius]
MKISKRNSHDNPFKKSRGEKRILGIRVQSLIKSFFGTNAATAVVVIAAICFFLAKEAVFFFPDYRESLRVYRLSGQEFVDYMREESSAHRKVVSLTAQAYGKEVYGRTQQWEDVLETYNELLYNAKKAAKGPRKLKDRAQERAESIAAEIDPSIKTAAEKEIAQANVRIKELTDNWLAEATIEDLERPEGKPSKDDFKRAIEAVQHKIATDEEHPFITQTKAERDEAKAKAVETLAPFLDGLNALRKSRSELDALIDELVPHALKTKGLAEAYKSAIARRAALEQGAANLTTEEDRRRAEIEAARILTTPPAYAERNAPLYASRDRHAAAIDSLLQGTRAALPMLDERLLTDNKARKAFNQAKIKAKELEEVTNTARQQIRSWNHEENYSGARTFFGFFFGKQWVTNSSWQDFYGLAPLFSGSLIIALIALVISVPFAVGAAVYVNQLSSPTERNLIKPAIEFIGAIPSIVLGLFGILVLGELLQTISKTEWLADLLPGFPIDQRLNMLNAGTLLSFMAIPTIFTLAEDALNNVPRANTEASLALGASKLQTVLKVVFPAALSGILAAVLLGFGRVIGETMVVLLVAGNRIAVPDFSKGLGVITDPSHTMTGIIAQEMGEVSEASLHWRALFMVGLVLFLIALVLNFVAQKVVRKFSKHN